MLLGGNFRDEKLCRGQLSGERWLGGECNFNHGSSFFLYGVRCNVVASLGRFTWENLPCKLTADIPSLGGILVL